MGDANFPHDLLWFLSHSGQSQQQEPQQQQTQVQSLNLASLLQSQIISQAHSLQRPQMSVLDPVPLNVSDVGSFERVFSFRFPSHPPHS
jgi:hypothetical protein